MSGQKTTADAVTGKATWKVGDVLEFWGGPVRVMAIAEGYAMIRRPRCMPRVVALKDLIADPQPRPEKE